MSRLDYLDDPDAPKANSLVPSANAIVLNDHEQFLLIRRTDNDNWSLPGGAMDLGETIAQTAVREVKEETGVDCEILSIIGIYTTPGHILEYTSTGEVRQEFSVVFTAHATAGEPTPSDESSEVAWVTPAKVDDYPMHPSMRERIDHYLNQSGKIHIG
jgi:8-oxo-dGTP pyrophosphatase MutT (NUDIX family)